MCDPVSITMAALSTVQTVSNYQAQADYAEAQEEAVQENYRNQVNQLMTESYEQAQTLQSEMMKNQMEGMKAQSASYVSVGESGLQGATMDRILADAERVEAENSFNLEDAYSRNKVQLDLQGKALADQANNQLENIQQPNKLMAALQIAQGGLQAYGMSQSLAADSATIADANAMKSTKSTGHLGPVKSSGKQPGQFDWTFGG